MRKIGIFSMIGLFFAMSVSVSAHADVGTKEDAVTLVEQAVAYVKKNGTAKAFETFAKSDEFKPKGLAVTVTGLDGINVVHPNAKIVGKSVLDMKDVDGKLFIREYINIAQTKGKGWVDYKWPNPTTGAIGKRIAYVERVDEYVIGCAVSQ